MTELTAAPPPRRFLNPWRVAGWGALAALLSLPAILRFPWTASDFLIMGVLLGSVGLGIEFLIRQSGSTFVRLGAAAAVLTTFLTIWVNLAVGMIGDGEPYNLLFLIPPAVTLGGGLLVRLRPMTTSRLALLSAALQVAIALGGYGMDPRGAIFGASFGLLWLLTAALFRAGFRR